MSYIINLITKIFLFYNYSKTFKADIVIAKEIRDFEEFIKLLKNEKAINQLQNLI